LAGSIGKTPVVVVSTHSSGDRQRFTLAHELGHLMLHGDWRRVWMKKKPAIGLQAHFCCLSLVFCNIQELLAAT